MSLFHEPDAWPPRDLIAGTRGLNPGVVLEAYRYGLFPMPLDERVVGWFSPMHRGVLPLSGVRVTRSLRKSARHYTVTVDRAFDEVVAGCADPSRPDGWINAEVTSVYRQLHDLGVVHSVETWNDQGILVGGLYGVSIGGLFAGESMFHDPQLGRDASKVALLGLVELLDDGTPGRLLDVQWQTPHLASLGVIELERPAYLAWVREAVALPAPDWQAARRANPRIPG